MGGFGPDSTMPATVLVFDAIGERFTPGGELLSGRVGHSATLLADGKVLLVAGSVAREAQISATADLYDPVADKVTRLPGGLRHGRVSHHATLLKSGKVLITGGENGNYSEALPPELYDPVTQSFSTLAPLANDAAQHINALVVGLDSGDVLELGGNNLLAQAAEDRVVQFNEAACAQGSLGTFPAKEALSLAMAHAGRLMKFGA